jgi:REP element-mobilizing transposase RayT
MKGQRLRYRQTGDFHFLTFSCYRRRPYLSAVAAMELFEDALERVRLRHLFVVAGYVVMPKHVHLLVDEPKQDKSSGNSLPVKVRVLTPRQVILWLTTALDFEIMLTERRESIGQQVLRKDSMKQSTSTSPKNQTSRTNSPSVGEFFGGPIESVYIDSSPPRGKYAHGSTVDFFSKMEN